MKFTRPKIITHQPVAGSFDANGEPTTTPVTTQTSRRDLILGDGSSEFTVLQKDGKSIETITTVLTGTAFTDEATFEVEINGNRVIFVTIHTEALGANASGVGVLIEVQDPDHRDQWIPSKEGINREAKAVLHEWVITGVGSRLVKSREEHRHCVKARVRFKLIGGVADADTKVLCSWTHDGGRSLGELHGNDPGPVL